MAFRDAVLEIWHPNFDVTIVGSIPEWDLELGAEHSSILFSNPPAMLIQVRNQNLLLS